MDGLARPIASFEERVYRHRRIAPPDWVTEEYGAGRFQGIGVAVERDLRAGVVSSLVLCHAGGLVIAFRIGFVAGDLDERSVGLFGDRLGKFRRVADFHVAHAVILAGAGKIHHYHAASFR